ncbi:MAG: hypothetical protein PF569_04880 [Candidatus Woesearchaeota archaeon]|jgi:hypothetical protein|nr:hypothetical protein [Candidatus Woesearchaeota archaeon]
MFNPFKKKENEFKLDDYELPSLGDSTPNNEELMQSPFPTNPSLETTQQNNPSEIPNSIPSQTNSHENSFNEEEYLKNGNTQAQQQFSNPYMNTQLNTPQENQQQDYNNNNQNSNTQNLHNDITKAKLDSIESRVTLMDSKLSSIEQKLEILTKLIMEEVSEETKRKLKLDNMMDKVRK